MTCRGLGRFCNPDAPAESGSLFVSVSYGLKLLTCREVHSSVILPLLREIGIHTRWRCVYARWGQSGRLTDPAVRGALVTYTPPS